MKYLMLLKVCRCVVAEFHQTQLVAPQPVHPCAERGYRQEFVVDGKPRSHLETSAQASGNDGLGDCQTADTDD